MAQTARLILPELWQIGMVILLFGWSLIPAKGTRTIAVVMPCLAAFGIVAAVMSLSATGSLFFGAYTVDPVSQYFKLAITLGFAVTVLNALRQPDLEEEKHTDYFMLLGLSALGLMLLASAVELITIYLAMELSSYSLYALLPLRARDRRAAEAGVKYILFGAVATAVALYGLSYIVAVQHSTYLAALRAADWSWDGRPVGVIGLSLFLIGFFYKLALFPFHFWAPDVYQGSSNETATYVATLPKLGALVILIRLASLFEPTGTLVTIMAVLAAVSMTYGNLAALAQKDLKRMLGYSTVAHAGYAVVGLVAATSQGLASTGFYAFAYILMNLTCFWVICRVAADGRNLTLDDLNGLYKRQPGLACALAVGAFALVGIPPTVGFMGKLFVLAAAWNRGYNWLVVLAAVNTAISLYYYLSMVLHAYTKDQPERAPAYQPEPVFSVFWGGVLAVAVLIVGMFPGPVFDLTVKAGSTLMP